jgi:hypothetical protein
MVSRIYFFGILFLFFPCILGSDRIDLLLIGHVTSSFNPVTTFLDPDPSVRYTMVPTTGYYAVPLGGDEARRYVKQYFPRSYEEVASYGFIMYSIPYIIPLTQRQINLLIDVVTNGECAALTDQGGLRMKGVHGLRDAEYWVSSGMSDIFANDAEKVLQTGMVSYSNAGYRLSIKVQVPHQVLGPLVHLGIEKIPALGIFHTIPKDGTTVIVEARGDFLDIPGSPSTTSWLMHFECDEGVTWTLCDNFVNPFWCGMYYGKIEGDLQTDVLMNIIWYSVGLELPGDPLLVHRMRIRFRDFIAKRGLQVSLVEFVDRLGANLIPAENLMAEADQVKFEAEELYLEQNYDLSSQKLEEAFDLLQRSSDLALRQKRLALLWVYIIEWTAVTGTLMISGIIVYSLMIRRRLYRESGITRLVEPR